MLAPVRIAAPAATPVTLDEAKRHLRVTHDDDDMLITSLIAAAVDYLDGWTGILRRCLVEQTWRQDFERFALCLPLALGPVIEIVSVASDAGAVDPAGYSLVTDAGGRARVESASGVSVTGPVSVTYKAGYPTTPEQAGPPVVPATSTVPPALKAAVILLVRDLYVAANAAGVVKRETVEGVSTTEYHDTSSVIGKNPAVEALITPFRRVGV